MKIVVLDGHAVNPGDLNWDWLKEFGTVTVYERTPDVLAAERIADAQIVLLNKVAITQAVLDQCRDIRLICVLATGYNVVDCAAARARGIPVCNVPAYSTQTVAQFTFSLLLELCNRVGHHDTLVHGGAWTNCPDFCFWDTPQMELAGKALGIVGFGRIGRTVARIASAFGMHIMIATRTPRVEAEEIGECTDLDMLLQKADIVSLHCPLTAQNAGFIDAQAIAKMKDGAILINTARGGLIDEQAVADALKSGKLCGYAADVVAHEPIKAHNPLLDAPNCVLTPHMAWAPIECRKRIIECTIASIRGFLNGETVNTVN